MSASSAQCLCGKVAVSFGQTNGKVTACHCDQCRQTSGHYWASLSVPLDSLRYTNDEGLKWFQSTDVVRKGFCKFCGSSILWQHEGKDVIAVAAGCLERPTGTTLTKHIFVSEKGDYYGIGDGLPQASQFDLDPAPIVNWDQPDGGEK